MYNILYQLSVSSLIESLVSANFPRKYSINQIQMVEIKQIDWFEKICHNIVLLQDIYAWKKFRDFVWQMWSERSVKDTFESFFTHGSQRTFFLLKKILYN